jgi:two-component system sensor histidine kinase YesM
MQIKKFLGSIRVQMFLICLVCMILMQAILVSSYYQFRDLKIQDNREHFQELLTQVSTTLELNCTYLNDILEQIAYGSEVQEYLENTDENYRRENKERIISLLNSMSKLRSGIKDIAIVDAQGNCTNLNGNIYQMQKLAEEIPEKCMYYYTGMNELIVAPSSRSLECFTVGAPIYSTSDQTNKERLGTVLISFHKRYVFEFAQYGHSDDLPEMLAFDRDNKLVYSSVKDDIDTSYENYFDIQGEIVADCVVIDGQTYYIQSSDMEMMNGKFLFLISQKDLFSGMENIQERMIVLFVINVILMILVCLLLLKRVIYPLNQFMDWLRQVQGGNRKMMKKPIQLKGATEIESMSEQFNGMMQEVNVLTHQLVDTTSRLYESELEKQRAELEYLYSQINPHFLFNTLESVKGCAVEEEAWNTFKMVNALGKIFRYSVRSVMEVALCEELDVVDSYMYIQQSRFKDRITYFNRVSDKIHKAVIPKMIIQPLVENAVIHGVEEHKASTIWLDGSLDGDVVTLTVTNDGEGISKETLDELNMRMQEKIKSSHIGLSNIYRRVKRIYGDSYGLQILEKDSGFCVMVKIPLQLKPLDKKGEIN